MNYFVSEKITSNIKNKKREQKHMYFQNFISIYKNSNDKLNDLDIRNDLYSNVYLCKDTCLFGMCGYGYD